MGEMWLYKTFVAVAAICLSYYGVAYYRWVRADGTQRLTSRESLRKVRE